jgi:hypothetical protein
MQILLILLFIIAVVVVFAFTQSRRSLAKSVKPSTASKQKSLKVVDKQPPIAASTRSLNEKSPMSERWRTRGGGANTAETTKVVESKKTQLDVVDEMLTRTKGQKNIRGGSGSTSSESSPESKETADSTKK